jgi:hypothetical protein
MPPKTYGTIGGNNKEVFTAKAVCIVGSHLQEGEGDLCGGTKTCELGTTAIVDIEAEHGNFVALVGLVKFCFE